MTSDEKRMLREAARQKENMQDPAFRYRNGDMSAKEEAEFIASLASPNPSFFMSADKSNIETMMYQPMHSAGYMAEVQDPAKESRMWVEAPLVSITPGPKFEHRRIATNGGTQWYCDGLPVDELKRRYEVHDALVAALKIALNEVINSSSMESQFYGGDSMVIEKCESALAAAGVKP